MNRNMNKLIDDYERLTDRRPQLHFNCSEIMELLSISGDRNSRDFALDLAWNCLRVGYMAGWKAAKKN